MFILCSSVIYFVCFLSYACIHICVCKYTCGGQKTNSDAVPQALLTIFFENRISRWFETHQVGKAGWSINLRDYSVSTFPVQGLCVCYCESRYVYTSLISDSQRSQYWD